MTDTIKIPKFRKVSRIYSWMKKNEYYERIPQAEELFYSTKEESHIVLDALTDYHECISEFPDSLKDLIYEKAKEVIPAFQDDSSYVHDFLTYCYGKRDVEDAARIEKYIDLFAGKSRQLLRWANFQDGRLPKHLEDTISDPDVLLDYAKDIVKGRVPSHLEDVFHKDVHCATQYAFDVIRGFAPVKLPDNLHNFVIMESFKNPNDYHIKNYMKASESDPNKSGNE